MCKTSECGAMTYGGFDEPVRCSALETASGSNATRNVADTDRGPAIASHSSHAICEMRQHTCGMRHVVIGARHRVT